MKDWTHYLTRPHNLFTASIWSSWYTSNQTKNFFGFVFNDVVLVEFPSKSVRFYCHDKDLQSLRDFFERLFLENREKCVEYLNRGLELNKEAGILINSDIENIKLSLSEITTFITELAYHTALLPYFLENVLKSNPDQEITGMCEGLRSQSFYPLVLSRIIIPMAENILVSSGYEKNDLDYITMSELLGSDFTKIKTREDEKDSMFVYEINQGKENVYYGDTRSMVQQTEGEVSIKDIINGTVAYPGVVSGKVKIVSSFEGEGVEFNDGDILVASHTSPNLTKIMKKAGAIVTDEGGVMSHTAIVAREMKKPCVIGTKIATQVLKDGDMVEVDADNGVVRIIK